MRSASDENSDLTLLLGLATSLAPNRSLKAFSTVFLISSGLAQRRVGKDLTAFMVVPRSTHPEAEVNDLTTCS